MGYTEIDLDYVPYWAGKNGESIEGVITATPVTRFGTTFTVELVAPARITVKDRESEDRIKTVSLSTGDSINLPAHKNLMQKLEKVKAKIGNRFKISSISEYDTGMTDDKTGEEKIGIIYKVEIFTPDTPAKNGKH